MQADKIKPSLTEDTLKELLKLVASIPVGNESPAEELLHNDPYLCAVLLKYYGEQSCKV